MFLLGCEKVRVDFPTKTVFTDLTLGIEDGARIGIVGRNGDAKSTLLALLCGQLEPDSGRVVRTRGVRVGLLGQTDDLDDAMTVERAVIGNREQYEWASDQRIRGIIDGLLDGIDWHGLIGTLSGGQRRRVDLARLLVGEWDVLALDEPTNHLDIRAITWLANHLKTRWKAKTGVLLVVTHDRWFLDETCLDMWEVHDGLVEPFEGGFSAYIMQRVERDRLATLAEQKRQNALRRELAWLSRGARARATKPKFHVAAARALIADVPPLRDSIELKRMACARLGKQVIDLVDATVDFGDGPVLRNVTWLIGPGDRYGILGVNGVGKTTLLRTIQGLQPLTSGTLKIGKTVRFGVLSQSLDNLVEAGSDRVRQVVARYPHRKMLDDKEYTPKRLLEKLGFTNDDMNEPVCDLSGGQKRRLALMMLLLDEPNVLILDEPGNDLDTDMLAAVEDLLDGWPGTLILVTHDRYLMERVTDHQFALIDGVLRHVPRGVDEYLELLDERGDAAVQDVRAVAQPAQSGTANATDTQRVSENAQNASNAVQAAGDAVPKLTGGQIRTLRKTMDSSETKMATVRAKIEDARQRMAQDDPTDFEGLLRFQEEFGELEQRLEELELAWLEAAEQLGE